VVEWGGDKSWRGEEEEEEVAGGCGRPKKWCCNMSLREMRVADARG
jgi:hypothetical protein